MAPFSPTMAAIRYGYGLSPGQVLNRNLDDLLVQLADAPLKETFFPVGGAFEARQRSDELADRLIATSAGKNGGELDRDGRKLIQQKAEQSFQRDSMARVMQAVFSPYGFHERLASFWVDHFSVNARKAVPMRLITPLYEVEAIRPHLAGPFRDLLQAAVLHPAMLIYLDQNRSTGPESAAAQKSKRGLNENLGRELLELHTMGAGSGYTQSDVRSAALVLTGMTVDDRNEMLFRPNMAEPGQIKVLGMSYGGDKRTADDCIDMLDDLATRPETAVHVCRKLCAHFIADEVPPDVLSAMVDEWKASKGNLVKVYAAMLNHPRAWSDPGRKMKLPFDYVVSGLRAFGITQKNWQERLSPVGDEDVVLAANAVPQAMAGDMNAMKPGGDQMTAQAPDPGMKANAEPPPQKPKPKQSLARTLTLASLRRMGQPVWQPPSPAGFEEGVASWLSPSQMSERILWARKASDSLGGDMEPKRLLEVAMADMARDDTIRVVSQAPSRVSGMTLALSSPEFNRR
ncbi:DUF1800 domain-containing protein [Agrobacterium rubi]|uniref:DUF1800 domain-containing protein n=1 Tax=Agrobacterium rubi TaxID=28099 RepID=A0AAE7R4N5_9HYPH|nr:DUF1800 domain-containing protein [Agrobacterium rubi]NTE86019.1 DUF1800 domain-containing protein [Agrobacterium rubi]NTF01950.1 DUF1800 domain-containing protein [Agrobacterium rubi]NTF36194.1 DUF1800 domain-containing protein [Agrobacterium rubi]OCJ54638.1 hypothetical protein A6U92_21585 [Agrobacterium rubi]QTG01276.1 DUF1800 domain-containing protein [Agrobacterium rubi]